MAALHGKRNLGRIKELARFIMIFAWCVADERKLPIS